MQMKINENFYLSDLNVSDKAALVEYLREKQIHLQTLAIPFPYTEADADWWINFNTELIQKNGTSVNWAIRRSTDNFLVGGIGFHDLILSKIHRAEIGYWLAKVLEKAGYQIEGQLRNHYKKEGQLFDGKVYGMTSDDFGRQPAFDFQAVTTV